jgi:hypothetical protein
LKITEVAQIVWDTFINGNSYVFISTKNGLGYTLGDFFTSASGHSASSRAMSHQLDKS